MIRQDIIVVEKGMILIGGNTQWEVISDMPYDDLWDLISPDGLRVRMNSFTIINTYLYELP